jgi:DNA-binding transcriptional ArsR family regulator
MLRIHFSPRDWQRVRVVTKPDPMWEIVLSLYMLGEASDEIVFGQWRRRVLSRIAREHRILLDLVPPTGYAPDFLSPVVGGHDPDEGIAAVLDTPRKYIADNLDRRFGSGRRPAWTTGLARKDSMAVRRLGRSLRSYFDLALGPYWSYINHVVKHEATALTPGDTESPVAAILRGKEEPSVCKAPHTVVEIAFSNHQTLHLAGRGINLIPGFFCALRPVTFRDPSLPPALLYPVTHQPGSFLTQAAQAIGPAEKVLAQLLGRTRAAVLRALSDSVRTTSEIAAALNISIASASEHASLLRAAGLVASERYGNSVRHWLTPLGLELLYRKIGG